VEGNVEGNVEGADIRVFVVRDLCRITKYLSCEFSTGQFVRADNDVLWTPTSEASLTQIRPPFYTGTYSFAPQ
jgi:hypothetical protein